MLKKDLVECNVGTPLTCICCTWAASFSTWLLNKLTPKGVVYSFSAFAVGEAASVSRQLPFSSGPQMNHTAAVDRGSPVSLRSNSNSPHAQQQVSSLMCPSSFVAFSQQSQLSGAGNTCQTEAYSCEYLMCKTFAWPGLPPMSCTALVH